MTGYRRLLIAAAAAVGMLTAGQFTGCSTSSTLPTQPSIAQQQATATPNVAAKGARSKGSLYDQEVITPEDGGSLWVGNSKVGYTSLVFPAGAVSAPITITMQLNSKGPAVVDCQPSGTQFLQPATMTISYYGVTLTTDLELSAQSGKTNALGIFVQEVANGAWQPVPGSEWQPEYESVTAPIWHFSRYAIGSNG